MRNFHASLLALSSSGGDLVRIPLLLSMSEDYHSKYSSSIFTEEIKITSKAETVKDISNKYSDFLLTFVT